MLILAHEHPQPYTRKQKAHTLAHTYTHKLRNTDTLI